MDAAEEHEGAHGFAIGTRRQLGAWIALSVRRTIDDATDRGRKFEFPDFASQRDGTEHGAAIGIDRHGSAGEIVTLCEKNEMARRVSRNRARRRDKRLAVCAARFGGALRA